MSITDFVSLHVRPFSTLTDTPVSDLTKMDSFLNEENVKLILETHPVCPLSPKMDNIFALKINAFKTLKPDHVWSYI